jgi:voltage-gated potassium channel
MKPSERLFWGLAALAVVIVAGVIGYILIEGWSFLDALFMTLITVTTVGYSEVRPLSQGGQVFTMLLIVGGVGTAFYTLVALTEYTVGGYLGNKLGRLRMENRIAKLKNHFIICGYGRVGRGIAAVFTEEGVPFVVIENSEAGIANAEKDNHLYINDNATRDEVLKEAGIDRARGLVAAVGSDTDNTYIALSARGLRQSLFIAARASDEEAEKKLRAAGADRIVSPYNIGARRLAMLALRPAVVDYVDSISYGRGRDLQLENLAVNEGSVLVGKTVGEVSKCSNATIMAISRAGNKLLANPSADEIFQPGDQLIVIGNRENLSNMENTCEEVKPQEKDRG